MNNRKTVIENSLQAIDRNLSASHRIEFLSNFAFNPTLTKSIKDLYTEMIQLEDELEALLNWVDEEAITAQSLADDVIAAINEGNELETSNPNRFIKSSFILSLLWVAKFYAALETEYKGFSSHATKAANCALRVYSALSYAIEPNGYLEDSAPITFDYLCFTC